MEKYSNIKLGSIVTLNSLEDAVQWKVVEREGFIIGVKSVREMHIRNLVTQFIDVACVAKVIADTDNEDLITATYYGNTPEQCRHIISSYLHYSQFGKLIEEHPNGYETFAPFEAWWNEYISDEDSFLEEKI